MWRPTKNQLHLPSVPFLGSFVSFGVFLVHFVVFKKQQRRPQTTHPHEKCSLPRASRSLGSHLNGHVFFFLHPFGLHDWLLWEWSQVDPSLLFGVWFSLSFSCLNHLPLKDPLGWWLEVMMANNAKKRKGRGRKKKRREKKKKKNPDRRPLPSHTHRVPLPSFPLWVCSSIYFSALLIWALMAAPRWWWRGKRTCFVVFAFVCGKKKLFFENQNLIRINDHNISRSWQMACICVHPRFLVSERKKERKSLKVRGWLLIFWVFCVAGVERVTKN